MKIIEYIKLAKNRQVGYPEDCTNYIKFQSFMAETIIDDLGAREIDLKDKKVLELAVGTGGYSNVFNKYCKELVINDIKKPTLKLDKNITFKKFDASKKFPFEDNSFDFIFNISLIEHIEDPTLMLEEIKRVLKPEGYLFLSFPPFYSFVGGHFTKPFHYLPEKLCFKIVNKLGRNKTGVTCYKNMFGDFGLYKVTVDSAIKLLNKDFDITERWGRYPSLEASELTWHVCFLSKVKK